MESINMLHFSDLHIGWPSTDYNFNYMRSILYEDLIKKSKSIGDFQLIILTGDLTYSGTKEQFTTLTTTLEHMWNFFNEEIKCNPYIVCVPGNHDLLRPDIYDPAKFAIEEHYYSDNVFYEDFWENFSINHYGKIIDSSFEAYSEWYANLRLPKLTNYKEGIMPGDFSAIYEINDISIGFVGLNSAFLQLGSGDYKGKIEITPNQLFAVCDNDPKEWLKNYDFTFLLSHHGSDWYSEIAKVKYYSDIYQPGRFSSHIYGHVHDAKTEITSISGAAKRRYQIGKSIYGMTFYHNYDGNDLLQQRSHGYNINSLSKNDRSKAIKLWPRSSVRRTAGDYMLAADRIYSLNDIDESICLMEKSIAKNNQFNNIVEGNLDQILEEVLDRLPILNQVLQKVLDRLPIGKIAFNPPNTMKLGIKERIEARISKDVNADLKNSLKGHGFTQIEELRISELMKVRLSGDDFSIISLNEEEQIIESTGFTEWAWDVTPTKSGKKIIHLHVTLRIRLPFGEERKDQPVLDREIVVQVNPIYSIKLFVIEYWKWILTAFILPIVGWVWKTYIK